MARQARIEVIDAGTIRIVLPDNFSVAPGKPVPPDLLEMLASYFRMKDTMGGEADCVVQFN